MSDNKNDSKEVPEKIMRLITALMARANHPNTPQPEVDLCNTQLQRLMLKHSISEAKANATQQQKSHIGAWVITIPGTHARHRSRVLSVVAEIFSCKVVTFMEKRTVHHYELIGREGDLAMVFTLFAHLLEQIDANLLGKAGRTVAFKKSYIISFADGLYSRLKNLYDEEVAATNDVAGTELVLANILVEIDIYMANESDYDGQYTGRPLSHTDYMGAMSGEEDAKKADIFLPGARFDANERQAISV